MLQLLQPRNSTQYVISGTKYLRLGSRSIFNLYGTNLQNIEKDARKMYLCDVGCKLNQRDQSGAEALIVAYLCRHGQFRELFLNNIKPHVFVALHLFREIWKEKIKSENLDIHADIDKLCSTSISNLRANPFFKSVDKLIKSSDNWKPSERYYYIAKMVCHASNYGIRAGAFCINSLEKSRGKIALTKKQAEFFLDMYHSLFPEIREWHREVEQQVLSTKMLFNLFGEPIMFTGSLEKENDFKEAISAVPQSTVGEITNVACMKFQNYVEDTGMNWDLLGNCHDSFLTQSPEDESVECQRVMKEFIEPELTSPRGEKFKMKSEGGSGYNWGPHDEKKNPRGLQEVEL